MSSLKVAATMVHNIRRHTLLEATRPPRSGNGFLGGCFTSISTPPPEGRGEGIGEKAKQTMDNVMGSAKENAQKLKDRVLGNSGGCSSSTSGHPSKNPELNHGVESTDSSCEDVRDRPGGYN